MKNIFMLTLVGIFLAITTHNNAHIPAQAHEFELLLKNTQYCIEGEYGRQELKYNIRLKKFFQHCNQLKKSTFPSVSIAQMVALSNDVLGDYQAKSDRCYQQVKNCTAVYGVYGLLGNYSNQCLELLEIIDRSLVYWNEQAHHPVYYFFHKSPLKWFKERHQQVEIKKKIALLQSYKECFCNALGVAIVHRELFAAQQDQDALMAWVHKGLDLISLTKKSKKLLESQSNKELSLIKKMDKIVNNYVSFVEKKLHNEGLLKPSHPERHWIFYSSAALATLLASWYITKHHEQVVNAQKALAIMQSEMAGDLRRPFIGFKEAFLQDSHAKEANVKKVWDNLEQERTIFVKRAMQFFPETEFSSESLDKIRKNLIQLKTSDISDRYLLKMGGGTFSKIWNGPDIGAGIIYEVNGLKLSMLGMINEVYDELFKNVRGNKFTIAVASSVPLYGIFIGLCAGLNKVYGAFFYRWFNALALQTTLKKIKDIFIDVYHLPEVPPAVYGNLIYLVTVLRDQVHCVAKHQKADFIHDCDRLASAHMTAQQKIQIITNMRAYYTHLC